MTTRIAPRPAWPRHEEALRWVNDLILDLKLIELGQKPNKPVDMARLNDWQKHRRDIEDCKARTKWE